MPLQKNQLLTEKEYRDLREKYEDDFDAGMGAEAIQKLLKEIDLEEKSEELKAELAGASGQKKARIRCAPGRKEVRNFVGFFRAGADHLAAYR